MDPRTYFEREEDRLVEQLNNGEITDAEFRAEMRDLRYDIQAQAEEAAQQAYDNEMARW